MNACLGLNFPWEHDYYDATNVKFLKKYIYHLSLVHQFEKYIYQFEKFIYQFEEIYLSILRNIFINLKKYIYHLSIVHQFEMVGSSARSRL